MAEGSHDTPSNRLLRLLPRADCQRLLAVMERVRHPAKAVICEAGQPIQSAYFPLDGVLSSVVIMENGVPTESATVGNEGMVGLPLLGAQPITQFRIEQQIAGESLRLIGDQFREWMETNRPFRQLIQQYSVLLWQQTAQNAACNLHHSVEERMCRWLLTNRDRVSQEEFEITQEYLSEMLGVRRQSVNLTARLLQQAGLIACGRGHLKVLNAAGLEQASCECYQISKRIYDQLLSAPVDEAG